jgi:hypothetical protein
VRHRLCIGVEERGESARRRSGEVEGKKAAFIEDGRSGRWWHLIAVQILWRSHVSVGVRDASGTIAAITERRLASLMSYLIYKTAASLTDKVSHVVRSDVARGASAPSRLLALRGQREIVCFIGLQNVPASFEGRHCEPNFVPASILATGRHLGSAGGDDLTFVCQQHQNRGGEVDFEIKVPLQLQALHVVGLEEQASVGPQTG